MMMMMMLRRATSPQCAALRRTVGAAAARRWLAAAGEAAKEMLIVFGSQSGTAEALAYDLEMDAEDAGWQPRVEDASAVQLQDLQDSNGTRPVALLLACYGEGEPTDNAKGLVEALLEEEKQADGDSAWANTRFAVFGLGNSQCFPDRYNVVGMRADAALQTVGAQRILPLGLGDAAQDTEADFATWKEQLLATLETDSTESAANTEGAEQPQQVQPSQAHEEEQEATPSAPVSDTDIDTDPATAGGRWARKVDAMMARPVPLAPRQMGMVPREQPLLHARTSLVEELLRSADEYRSCHVVEFDLAGAEVVRQPLDDAGATPAPPLEPGDHVCVFPRNSQRVVERFAAACCVVSSLDQPVRTLGIPTSLVGEAAEKADLTLRQVLTWHVQLTSPATHTIVKLLARLAKEQGLAAVSTELSVLCDTREYAARIRDQGVDVSELLDMFPLVQIEAGEALARLLQSMPALSPRVYSISHSPAGHPNETQLVSRLVRYHNQRNRVVDGVCSDMLAERLRVGDTLPIFHRRSLFHLPSDPHRPIIMIAGGTGLAPFLAFLDERARLLGSDPQRALGRAALYFGCRSRGEFLCRDALEQWWSEPETVKARKAQQHRELKALTEAAERPQADVEPARCILNSLSVAYSDEDAVGEWDAVEDRGVANYYIAGHQTVTSLVRQDIAQLRELVWNHGACIYVCGGSSGFGTAIRRVVGEIAMRRPGDHGAGASATTAGDGRANPELGEAHVRELIARGQYFEDLAD